MQKFLQNYQESGFHVSDCSLDKFFIHSSIMFLFIANLIFWSVDAFISNIIRNFQTKSNDTDLYKTLYLLYYII